MPPSTDSTNKRLTMAGIRNLCNWMFAHTVKVLQRNNTKLLAALISSLSVVLFFKLHVLCPVKDHKLQIKNVCQKYADGELLGSMCQDLCDTNKVVYQHSSCSGLTNAPIFEGSWANISIVFKTIETPSKVYNIGPHKQKIYPTIEDQYFRMIKNEFKKRYNMSVDAYNSDDNMFWKKIYILYKTTKFPLAYMQMENEWLLLHSYEYMTSTLYEKYNLFPKVVGHCGPLLAVQKLNHLTEYWHVFALYDTRDQWIDRIKVALKILDYLALLDSKPQEPLLICNMKLNNFGLTDDTKKVMYLDLKYIHPKSVADRITSNGSHCRRHSECDYMNCRSFCNLISFKCQHGVANNNLQIACEKLFLGWVSNRVMVPGLLIGPRTPPVLTEVLELCANPAGETETPRASASSDIRERLYNLLTQLLNNT